MKFLSIACLFPALVSGQETSYLRGRNEEIGGTDGAVFDPRTVALKTDTNESEVQTPFVGNQQQYQPQLQQEQQQQMQPQLLTSMLPQMQIVPQQQQMQQVYEQQPQYSPAETQQQGQEQDQKHVPEQELEQELEQVQQSPDLSLPLQTMEMEPQQQEQQQQQQQQQQLIEQQDAEVGAPQLIEQQNVEVEAPQLIVQKDAEVEAPQLIEQQNAEVEAPQLIVQQDAEVEAPQLIVQQDAEVEAPQGQEQRRRRKFVSYSSSEWELMWLDNVEKWSDEKSICEVLINEQAHYIHDYLNLLCSRRLAAPHDNWCVIDDDTYKLWYNAANRDTLEITFELPESIPEDLVLPPPSPITPGPEHSHIVSKFVFYDELEGEHYVEYIEPLISHLRFPLSKCITPPEGKEMFKYHDTLFRGWIIPPPPVIRGSRAVLVDAGASAWDKDTSSLKFFTNMWARNGVAFDDTFAFACQTPREEFYQALPKEHHSTIHLHPGTLSLRTEDDSKDNPFLPVFIQKHTRNNDYVVFKLDTSDATGEVSNIEHILSDPNTHVDEVVWENKVQGNYLMEEHWGKSASSLSLRESYDYFLMMRQKGIRAHSWV